MRLPVALLTAALAVASSTASAQTPADADAETAMREGIAATKEGRFEEAAAAYARAYAVAPRFDVAANLGDVELQLGRFADAAIHLEKALALMPLTAPPAAKKRVEEGLAKARAESVRVELAVTPPGETSVSVDDRANEVVDGHLYAMPGEHRIAVTRPGHRPASGVVRGSAGETTTLRLELVAEGGATPPPAVGAEPRPIWPAVALGGLGGVAAVGTVVFAVVSARAGSDADDAAARATESGVSCSGGGEAAGPCADFSDAASRESTFGTLAIVSGVSSALALGGMVTYLVWPDDDDLEAVRVRPVLGATTGVTLDGSF